MADDRWYTAPAGDAGVAGAGNSGAGNADTGNSGIGNAGVDNPGTDGAPLAKVTYLPGAAPTEQPSPGSASPGPSLSAVRFTADAAPQDDAGSKAEVQEAPATASEKAAARRADRAANVSMNALTRRGMSRWELEQILVGRELDPDEVEAELDRLASVGLIDDAALAETIVRTQHERKGLGRSALVAEMRRRHISPEQIEESLEQLDDDSELTRARELATKRAPQLRSLDLTTAKRRLTAFLMRKGYPSSVIRTAVDEALDSGGSSVRFR